MKSGYETKPVMIPVMLLLMNFVGGCSRSHRVLTLHSWSDDEVAVQIRGLKDTITVLHITDAHISIFDVREMEYHSFSARMDTAYREVTHYKTGAKIAPNAAFAELMDSPAVRQADVIALTGDIVNNPSLSSVGYVHNALRNTGIPWIYVAGNHDWHYEGMQGSSAALRNTWIQNSLHPLYEASDPLYSSHVIRGINFISIDNSTYQVTEDQRQFFQEQANGSLPIVLLMHIPLYSPYDGELDNIKSCGDPRWGWNMDKNYMIERRERWPRSGNLPSTIRFLEAVRNSPKVAAIFAGHTHMPSANRFSETAVQYVTGRAADGQHRVIVFQPLK